ncbi:MAG: hypothetical protein HYX75_20640 [Acidobacteria bacterium]|nr:hypothetical protein [Acidobacteriota bacterium]
MTLFRTLAIGIFVLVAIAHLSRIIFAWQVTVGTQVIPMWISVVGVFVPLLLVVLAWFENRGLRAQEDVPSPQPVADGTDPTQYQLAISLVEQQVQIFWLIFGAFLLAETVILGGILSVANQDSDVLLFGGALFGLILAFPWWTSVAYHNAMYKLRIMQARAYEPACGTFFTEGRALIQGKPVREVKMPTLAILLPARIAEVALILVFALAFMFLAFWYYPGRGVSPVKPASGSVRTHAPPNTALEPSAPLRSRAPRLSAKRWADRT